MTPCPVQALAMTARVSMFSGVGWRKLRSPRVRPGESLALPRIPGIIAVNAMFHATPSASRWAASQVSLTRVILTSVHPNRTQGQARPTTRPLVRPFPGAHQAYSTIFLPRFPKAQSDGQQAPRGKQGATGPAQLYQPRWHAGSRSARARG